MLSFGAASALRIDPTHGLHFGLTFGVGLGLLFGIMGGLGKGGSAYIKHYVLRILLWHNDYVPWNLVRFLDHAAERVFLRRVGGGYVFVHRLLMEYFAALEQRHLRWNMSRAVVEAMVPVLIVGLVCGIWYWAAWAWMHELSFRPMAERWVYQLRIKKLPLPGLIEIRNGTFMMGGAQEPYGKPVHRVTLSQKPAIFFLAGRR